jgi:hypothetical protein
MKTLPIGPFLGINNRLPDFALGTDRGRFLRAADNVDITNSGNVVRRKVEQLIQAVTAPHSLFKNYLVRASALYQVTLPTYSETLVKILSSNDPMSYVEYNGDIYYSNGTDSGRIAANGTVYPWALPTPAAPTVVSIPGALYKGYYQVAVAYSNSVTGEEGGISASNNYELAADGALRITLPAATTGATHINVYVSTVNGSIPMLRTTVTTGTATVDVTTTDYGRESNQRYEDPLPAGTRLFMHNGRLCSVKGKDLFYSLPYRPGYYLPVENRIPFPENVGIAVSNQGGVYVSADKTYFIAGQDLGAAELVRDVLPYGAVPGTEFHVPNKSLVGWFGDKGIVIADPQGEVQAVMSDNIDLTPLASGISTVFNSNGYRRVVSCGWCLNLDNFAATTYSSYDFTSTSEGYGTKADGVYLLESTSGGAVTAYIGLGKENFGVENLKRMPAVYLGVTSSAPMMLRVTLPNDSVFDYDARNSSTDMRVQRVDTGKGLYANWYAISVYNTEGSDFTLASVSFAPVVSGRRI